MTERPESGTPSAAIADLMRRAAAGDGAAAEPLFAALYRELRSLAEHHLRRSSSDFTIGATTLVHEAYLQLAGNDARRFPDESRFMAYASRAMRGIIIDYARARQANKRGGQFEITHTGVDRAVDPASEPAERLEALSAAMEHLARLDPPLAELVDMHVFAGFDHAEIARLRGVSERTVQRDWKRARLLLKHTLVQDWNTGTA
jgi:RNA polymerase sigma factor (TIGR02999 family)